MRQRIEQYYLRLDDGSYGYHTDSDYYALTQEEFEIVVKKYPSLKVDRFTSLQKGYLITNYCLDFYLYSKNGDKDEHV